MSIIAHSADDTAAVAHQFPASISQRRIVASTAHAHTLLLRCDGQLDCSLLERSCRSIIERNEILRTVIEEAEAGLVQLVLSADPRAVAVVDLSGLKEQVRRRSADAVIARFLSDSVSGLLFKVLIVRESADRHLCAIWAHPLIADEFTLARFLEELNEVYCTGVAGDRIEVRDADLQFADFSIWQSAAYPDASEVEGLEDLARKFSDCTVVSHNGEEGIASVGSTLSPRLVERLHKATTRDKAEGWMFFQAALAAVQCELTDREQLLLGVVDNGRQDPSLNRVLGPISTTRLLCWKSGTDQTFSTALLRLREEWDAAQAQQKMPYESLRKKLLRSDIAAQQTFVDIVYVHEPALRRQLFMLERQSDIDQNCPPHPDARITLRVREVDSSIELSLASSNVREQELQNILDSMLSTLETSLPAISDEVDPQSKDPFAIPPSPASHRQPDIQMDEIIQKLIPLWSSIFAVPSVRDDDDFFDLGGHSLLAVRLATRVEETFHVEIPLHWILEYSTIAQFAKQLGLLLKSQVEQSAHTLVPLQVGGSLPPLYWVPGGRAVSVMALREVSLLMGSSRSVYGIESKLPQPGESFLSVEERARLYVDLIRKHQPEGPYLLAGFCMGGMVALEIAQQLTGAGHRVEFLGMVQASVPGFPDTPRKRRKMYSQRRNYMMRTTAEFIWTRLFGPKLGYSRERRQDVLDRIANLMMGWVSTSSQLPEETQSENNNIMRAYRPSRYPGKVHIYLAKDCYETVGMSPELDPRQRWSALADGGSATFIVPGNHSTILVQPHARNLAEAIASNLPV